MLDYNEVLEMIRQDVETFEREELGESDTEVGSRSDEDLSLIHI